MALRGRGGEEDFDSRRDCSKGENEGLGGGGRRGWGVEVEEGEREAVRRDWAAAREDGEGGRSMSVGGGGLRDCLEGRGRRERDCSERWGLEENRMNLHGRESCEAIIKGIVNGFLNFFFFFKKMGVSLFGELRS